MPAPLVVAGAAIRHRRHLPGALLAGLGLVAVGLVLLIGVLGAIVGLQPLDQLAGPSGLARADIPATYLQLYQQAGQRYGIDPWVLAAIGSIETDHGRSTAPGVRSGVNTYRCCAGPMQFSVTGARSTWDTYGLDGDRDGRSSPYDPADAIPAAARHHKASGAPADYHAALFAYNHADWYVAQVLAKADQYRAAATLPTSASDLGGDEAPPATTVPAILANPRITLTALQRADVRSETLDPRLLAALAQIGRQHQLVITAMKSDHSTLTVDGNVSNHSAGRAMDIGAVDGETCQGTRTGRCADLVHELAAVTGPLRSTELIYCWDPDGPADPRGFARADHCDHIHVGWDA